MWWGVKMFMIGYHGTTLKYANSIIEEGKFHISSSDTEWLGDGIYYYFDINDAYEWRDNTEAILHSVIKIEDSEYLDIDSKCGIEIYNEMIRCISEIHGKKIFSSARPQQNQCAVMKMI